MHALCKTRCFQFDRIKILVFFVHGIHKQKEDYLSVALMSFVHGIHKQKEDCLSVAQILTSRYQSRIHCPFHESSLSNCHWMVWRRYFASNRLEMLLDKDDSRSLSRVREHWNFMLVSQLHVAIQTPWSQCLCLHVVWTNRTHPTGRPALTQSASTISSVSSFFMNVQQTTWYSRSQVWNVCRFPEYSLERDVCSVITGRLVLWIVSKCHPHYNIVCNQMYDECQRSNDRIVCQRLWSIL